MSNDLVIQVVDAIAAAKCAEIEARRMLVRLSSHEQERICYLYDFTPGRDDVDYWNASRAMVADIEQVRVPKEEVAKAFNIPTGTFTTSEPTGKTRGREAAEKYVRFDAFEDLVCIRDTDPGARGFNIPGNRASTAAIQDCITSIVDEACAAAVKDDRDRIRRLTACYAKTDNSELGQFIERLGQILCPYPPSPR